MDENGFKRKLRKILNKEGFVYCPNDILTSGIPDILGCFNGRFVALELKFSDKISSNNEISLHHPLTAKQSKYLRVIQAHGGIGLLVIGHSNNTLTVIRDITPGVCKKAQYSPIPSSDIIGIIRC